MAAKNNENLFLALKNKIKLKKRSLSYRNIKFSWQFSNRRFFYEHNNILLFIFLQFIWEANLLMDSISFRTNLLFTVACEFGSCSP